MEASPHQTARNAFIPPVGEDYLQSGDLSEQPLQKVWKALPVRIACRTDRYAKQKPKSIGNHVSFSPFDLLARVRAASRPALSDGWN